ncbi:hypothetical protein [Caballeronia cordobensis]|uniref:hypothetical protein n=1 Tax=Caballeronia cordobensis TaxID=1353886 RepID=UPI00045EF488|nr:hypothetical protein BRPE67_FCDS00050 [Burkholderia sp. RPE67]
MKKKISRKESFRSDLRRKMDELNSAVKVIKKLKSEPDKLMRITTSLRGDFVVVKVVPGRAKDVKPLVTGKVLPAMAHTKFHSVDLAKLKSSGRYSEQNLEDTRRATRTLISPPSEKVDAIYESLIAQRPR